MKNRMHQRGATLIEVMVATAILLLGVVAYVAYSRGESNEVNERLAATHLRAIAGAGQRYMAVNDAALRSATGSAATIVTSAQLMPLLPANVSTTGPQGDQYELRVRQVSGQLQGIIVSRTGSTAGSTSRARVSRLAGEAAGVVLPNGTVESPSQSWRVANHEWTSGAWGSSPPTGGLAYALFYDQATTNALAGSILHRHRSEGAAHLNQMLTAIDMAGRDVSGVGVLRSEHVAARAATADAGLQANWVAIGRAPWSNTPYGYETISVPESLTLRMYAGDTQLFAGRPDHVVFHRPSTLERDAAVGGEVDVVGIASASGLLESGGDAHSMGWIRSWGAHGLYNESFGGGWHMTDPNWVRSYNNRGIYTGGTIQSGHMAADHRTVNQNSTVHAHEYVGGDSTTAGDATDHGEGWVGNRASSHDLLARRVVQCNAACTSSETGVLARLGDGTPAACIAGKWECLGEGGGSSPSPPTTAGCSCPGFLALQGGGYAKAADDLNYSAQGACRGALNRMGLFNTHYCEWEYRTGSNDVCWAVIPQNRQPLYPHCP